MSKSLSNLPRMPALAQLGIYKCEFVPALPEDLVLVSLHLVNISYIPG
jgi:hypothetical protein